MHISIYSHYFAPEIGAPSARIADLGREWIRAGHDVRVLTCFPNHPVGEIYPGYRAGMYFHEELDGIDVRRFWSYVTPNKGVLKRTIGHVSFMASAMVADAFLRTSTDVIIGTSPTLFAAVAAARVAAHRNVPFVMEIRDLWPALFSELGVLESRTLLAPLEWLELSLYREAAGIVTVTEAFRQNLIERGIPPEKICTIPNGADVSFWQPALADRSRWRRSLGIDAQFVVLYIGAHGVSQGLGTVLSAAGRLRDDPSVVFVFAGEGADKAALMQRASRERLDNVRFVDSTDKKGVRDFYAAADVCLIPLRDLPLFSGFIPSKMFEILSMERPIIASVRGEAEDILERSGAAVVVSPEDDEAIVAAIRRLRDGQDREAMGRRGSAFVAEHYSRSGLAARYATFLAATMQRFRHGSK
jgi:glycosyltransferase involved in cell wall biosynthesis